MKILFVNPFGIGDVLFTTPLIRPLAEKGHRIYYWCNERVADILRCNGSVEGVFSLSRGDIKRFFRVSPLKALKRFFGVAAAIRTKAFDLAFDFSLDYRYSLILRLLGVRKIAGFDYKGRGFLLSHKIAVSGFDNEHMVEHYAKLLQFVDSTIKTDGRMELVVTQQQELWANELLRHHGVGTGNVLIGVAPGGGASWGKDAFRKQWPKEYFACLSDILAETGQYKIIIFGSRDDIEVCDYIAETVKKKVINICGRTTLPQLAALLKQCMLLIANDGGLLHMASALGVGTVSIFGPVDEKVYGPYPPSGKHVTVTADVECRPCYKNFRYNPCDERRCLKLVTPAHVLKKVHKVIRGYSTSQVRH